VRHEGGEYIRQCSGKGGVGEEWEGEGIDGGTTFTSDGNQTVRWYVEKI
jgi:hypothetical protein